MARTMLEDLAVKEEMEISKDEMRNILGGYYFRSSLSRYYTGGSSYRRKRVSLTPIPIP